MASSCSSFCPINSTLVKKQSESLKARSITCVSVILSHQNNKCPFQYSFRFQKHTGLAQVEGVTDSMIDFFPFFIE